MPSNGAADPRVAAAPAQIGDSRVDVRIAGARVLLQQASHGHDHPRLAVAALGDLLCDPGILERMGGFPRESLDGGNPADRGGRSGDEAGADRQPVEMHRTGPAEAGAAAELGTRQAEMVSEYPEKRRILICIDPVETPVDVKFHEMSPLQPASSSAGYAKFWRKFRQN
jgi:hypothetical protein